MIAEKGDRKTSHKVRDALTVSPKKITKFIGEWRDFEKADLILFMGYIICNAIANVVFFD